MRGPVMYTIDRETLIVVSVLCHHCIHSNFRQMASATWEWVSCLQFKKKKGRMSNDIPVEWFVAIDVVHYGTHVIRYTTPSRRRLHECTTCAVLWMEGRCESTMESMFIYSIKSNQNLWMILRRFVIGCVVCTAHDCHPLLFYALSFFFKPSSC